MKLRIVAPPMALVVLLVVLTTRTTGAFWSGEQNLGAGVVHTGDLVLLNGDSGTQVHAYSFTTLGHGNLAPGGFAQAPLTVTNAGAADLRYRLDALAATTTSLQDNLTLTATTVADEATCATTGTDPQPGTPVVATTLRSLPSAASEVLCLRLTLAGAAPQAGLSGTSSTVTFSWYGEQDL